MKRLDDKFQKYFYAGVTAFLVIAAALLLHIILINLGAIGRVLSLVNDALTPIYIGLIISFLLSPLVNKSERYIFIPLLKKVIKKEDSASRIARGCSVATVLILALLVVFSLIMMVVPEVIQSITRLAYNLPYYYRNLLAWGNRLFQSNPQLADYFEEFSGSLYEKLLAWLQNDILPNGNKFLSVLTDRLVNALNMIMDCIIGVIVSIYLMASKENFCAQAKKLLFAVLPVKRVDGILDIFRETHTVFAKFISGKLVDSLIVGILAFIILSIANIPYTMLISVVIGVTNIIPYFGPYIGTIPSAVLVLIANPMKGILFLALVIILQQFDGNILGPKILGESIGLKSFWILFSILFFGSLFGLLGMICAVPIFAMIYRWVKRWCHRRLAEKRIPTDTAYYRVTGEEKKVHIEKKHK